MRDRRPKQELVLQFIRNYWRVHGYSPSVRDIQIGLDISSTSVVNFALNALERKGLIKIPRDYTARAIIPLGDTCPCCGQEMRKERTPANAATG